MTNRWQVVKIRQICDIFTGGTPKTTVPDYWNGQVNWMSSGEVNKRRVSYVEKKITEFGLKNSNARVLPINSLMIALAGQGKTRGKVAILNVETSCNQSLAALVVKDQSEVNPEFVFQYLESRYTDLRNLSGGEGRTGLNLSLIGDFKVLKPSIAEQQKIALILFSIDEAIKKSDQIIEKTEKLKQGLMQNILGFNNKENIIHLALGEIGKVSMCKRIFKNETSNTGEIPFYKIGTFGKEPDSFISQGLYEKYRNKFSFPKTGDVLLSASGTIGRKVKYDGRPAYFQDSNIIWLEHDESKVLNDFLFYLYDTINWLTEGSTIKRLYNDNFLKKVVPVPSIEKQREICNIIGSLDSKLNVENKHREGLLRLKTGLMNDIFSQKVEVKNAT